MEEEEGAATPPRLETDGEGPSTVISYKPEQRQLIRALFHHLINQLTDDELEAFRCQLSPIFENKLQEATK